MADQLPWLSEGARKPVLTAPRKAVRFLVMSPTTRNLVADNAREWTGTLPETGDYYIIVDSDERNSTYSMTVSIK